MSFVSIAKNTSKSTRRKLGFSLKINKIYNKNSNYERIIKKVSDMLLEDGLSNPNNEVNFKLFVVKKCLLCFFSILKFFELIKFKRIFFKTSLF